jgi:hypothetical protein
MALWLALAVAIAGCASEPQNLSLNKCLAGDWRVIGFEDGLDGLPPERITDHVAACSRYGVSPDYSAWRLGYEDGVRGYCTPAGGFRAGLNGASYYGVCTDGAEEGFLLAYADGRAALAARAAYAQAYSYYNTAYYNPAYYDPVYLYDPIYAGYWDGYHWDRVRWRHDHDDGEDEPDPAAVRDVARSLADALRQASDDKGLDAPADTDPAGARGLADAITSPPSAPEIAPARGGGAVAREMARRLADQSPPPVSDPGPAPAPSAFAAPPPAPVAAPSPPPAAPPPPPPSSQPARGVASALAGALKDGD